MKIRSPTLLLQCFRSLPLPLLLLLLSGSIAAQSASGGVCRGLQGSNECYLASAVGETLLADYDAGGAVTSDSLVTVSGTASMSPTDDGQVEIQSSLNISKVTTVSCPSLQNADTLTQSELIARLTAPCRYDRTERPILPMVNGSNAVEVYGRTYVYALQSAGSGNFQFNLQALLQLRWQDPRLAFEQYAPSRRTPVQGESALRNLIWVPHLFFANEQSSSVLGTFDQDVLTSIAPNGTVVIATRIQATLFCWMQMRKFPFDEQYCTTTLESWMHNATDLLLEWEQVSPLTFNPNMQFTQYVLDGYYHNDTLVNAQSSGMWHGGFAGNYSSISFTMHMVHSAGYYVMDYFIPSMIMVAITWVSFWIRADQTAARTILCCSTMLSLITLASAQLKSSSSFITIFEVWFLGCVLFIFTSLVEFAFSNTIYRRSKDVQLKKVSSKCILKSAVAPRKARPLSTASSCGKLDSISFGDQGLRTTASNASLAVSIDSIENIEPPRPALATMTPQEVSSWLDKKSRFIFPLAYLIFNVFFWMFVLIL